MARISAVMAKIARKPGQRGLFEGAFERDVEIAIDPNVKITRFRRTWLFSKPHHLGSLLVGKLGFLGVAPTTETYYDDEQKDFVEEALAAKRVHYSHWVLDPTSQLMAFQTRPPHIKVQSFLGAFKELLNAHSELSLTVELISEPGQFYEWASRVDRIVSFRAALRAPNPDWGSRQRRLIDFIEKTNADRAIVEVKKEVGGQDPLDNGLVVQGTILEEMVEYGGYGYSAIKAEGFKDGQRSNFDSMRQVRVEQTEVEEGATQDRIWEALVTLLRRLGQHE